MPFTRAAYHDASGWHLRAPSVAASLELFIHDYQPTPAPISSNSHPNPDVFPALPAFSWKQAFSPVLRLSVVPKYNRDGSTGDEDFDLTTLAWGARDGHKLAAPVFEIDHNQYRFVGGRWIFAAADLDASFFSNTQLLETLADLATRKADRFTFRPRVPLFLPGEPLAFNFEPYAPNGWTSADQLKIHVASEDNATPTDVTIPADSTEPITLPASAADGKGLHSVEATLIRDGKPLRIYRSGFWIRDWDYLLSGPKLTVSSDYFQLDGKPVPVVGTTYMSSDVARLYLSKLNAWVWDQDMAQIHGEGLNMIRSGLWSGWDPLIGPDGRMTEDALRTIEAFLMCARHNHLPVQFNLFAFLPENLGGENPYLDPSPGTRRPNTSRRLHRDSTPSRSSPGTSSTSPAPTPISGAPSPPETLSSRRRGASGSPPAIPTSLPCSTPGPSPLSESAATSNSTPPPPDRKPPRKTRLPSRPPAPSASTPSAPATTPSRSTTISSSLNPSLPTGSSAPATSSAPRDPPSSSPSARKKTALGPSHPPSIRSSSTSPPITPGGTRRHPLGLARRQIPRQAHAHSGNQRAAPAPAGRPPPPHRRKESWQLERRLAIAFAQGAGALEWVWNVNSYMSNDNEIPIGAVRPDGTEKPEAEILSAFAAFAAKSPSSSTHIQPPQVAMVTSQALQYSGMNIARARHAKARLRALAYCDHTTFRFVAENRIADLGSPKPPSSPPRRPSDEAWTALLEYVAAGGTLLVTGPVQRNEHWQFVDRLTPLGVKAQTETLAVRQSDLKLENQPPIQVTFPTEVQQLPIDVLRFADGKSVEIINHGSGHILWARDPVEFSEDYEPTAALYRYALKVAGVAPVLREFTPLSPGPLLPTVLNDAVLYSFSNESLDDQPVAIEDTVSHATVRFTLPAQRGAAILLRESDGAVLAAYGAAAKPK